MSATRASSSAQSQRLGHRLEPVQQLVEILGDQPLVAVGVQDDDRVQAVTRCAPLVLLHMPRRHGRQSLAGVEPAVQVDDQAMGQRDQRAKLAEVGDAVEDPHLDRAQMRRRPDVPTDFVHVVDDAGLLLVVDEAFPLAPTSGSGTAARPSAAAGTSSRGCWRSRCPRRPRTATTPTAPAGADSG